MTREAVMRFPRRSILLFALAPAAVHSQSLDGVWRSQGYGFVFEIQGRSLSAWEVTATTCVKSLTATGDSVATPGRAATFRTKEGNVFFVKTGGTENFHLLHYDGAASDMRIDRVAAIPAVCTPPTADTPINNFEVFTRTWADHYILFDQKQIDWAALTATNRAKVTDSTTPAQLFDIMEGMIKPLDDAHTSISAPAMNRRFGGLRSGTDAVIRTYGGFPGFRKDGMPKLLGLTEQKYLIGPIRKFCNDQVQYGHLTDTTGYLRITSFSGYGPERTFASGLAALETALDTIFSDPKLKALVIDVRINFGGADPYGLAIASRLASTEYLAYTKEARADPADRNKWTPGDRNMVTPSGRPGFRGPVVELTGGLTISAGETFTQAMMGRTPHITRVGENTQGVFSDVLGRNLPNGWRFGLPNEVFRAADGKTFDGVGIPPDVVVALFTDADVAAGRDPALEKALAILAKQ
jgi:hypothetical protein